MNTYPVSDPYNLAPVSAELGDDMDYVRSPGISPIRRTVSPTFGRCYVKSCDSYRDAMTEVTAYRLSKLFGVRVPKTVYIGSVDDLGPDCVLSVEAPGKVGVNTSTVCEGQVMAAALFDIAIGNRDRHSGNYLWDGTTLTLIDHAYSMSSRESRNGGYSVFVHRARDVRHGPGEALVRPYMDVRIGDVERACYGLPTDVVTTVVGRIGHVRTLAKLGCWEWSIYESDCYR